MRLKKIVFISFIFLSFYSMTAQIKYDIEVDVGITDFRRTKYESFEIPFIYELGLNYKLGLGIYFPIEKKKIGIRTGLNIKTSNVKNKIENLDINMTPESWIESYYSIDIPIQVSYSFEKWVLFNLGVSNRFNIKHSKEFKYGMQKEKRAYTIAFVGGVDFILKKKYILGINYYRDLSTFIKLKEFDIYYGYQQVSLKLGYILN